MTEQSRALVGNTKVFRSKVHFVHNISTSYWRLIYIYRLHNLLDLMKLFMFVIVDRAKMKFIYFLVYLFLANV